MRKLLNVSLVTICMIFLSSCKENSNEIVQEKQVTPEVIENKVVESIMTAEEQAGMTPDEIINRLKKGNQTQKRRQRKQMSNTKLEK